MLKFFENFTERAYYSSNILKNVPYVDFLEPQLLFKEIIDFLLLVTKKLWIKIYLKNFSVNEFCLGWQ